MIDSEAITVIIPVYNAAQTINACIKSILAQSYINWRLILIDDGSIDESLSICESWADQDDRISVFSQKNSGAGAARNRGIKECVTRWLTFVDADDLILPEYLSNFHSEVLKDGDISVQGYIRITPDGVLLNESKNFSSCYYGDDSIVDCFEQENLLDYGQTVGKLYETELIKRNSVRFTSDFRLSEDHLFFLQILPLISGVKMNSGSLYYYQEWGVATNITKQSLRYDEAFSRFVCLQQAAEVFLNKFNTLGSRSRSWLDTFIYTGGLSLVINSLYKNNVQYSDRLKSIQWLKSSDHKYINKFNPRSIKGKGVKFIIRYFPVKMSDFILSRVFVR